MVSNNANKSDNTKMEEPFIVDYCSLNGEQMRALVSMTHQERMKQTDVFMPLSQATPAQVQTIPKLSFLEDLTMMIFLAMGVPNGVFTIPIVTFLIGRFVVGNVAWTFTALIAVLVPLALLPQPFIPTILHSKLAVIFVKYFAFRFIVEEL